MEERVLKYKDHVVFGKIIIPYFERAPKTYQENEACFIFVNKGSFSVRAAETQLSLNPSNAMLAKCVNYFMETNKAQRTEEGFEMIGVLLYPSLIKELFAFDVSQSDYELDYNLVQVEVDHLLENFRQSISILIDNPELADEQMIKTKIKEFVLLLSKSQNAPTMLDFLAGLFKPREVAFKTVIKQNLYSSLKLDELARLTNLSLSSFKRKFNEVYGQPPKHFITQKKLEKACALLQSKDYRISDIAYDVGFESVVTFNRNFTSTYKKSPSEYRLNFFEKSLS